MHVGYHMEADGFGLRNEISEYRQHYDEIAGKLLDPRLA